MKTACSFETTVIRRIRKNYSRIKETIRIELT